MSKFHINKHGVPAPCKAKEGNCPLGDSSSHFDSQEEAQEYANKILPEEHGVLPGVSSSNIPENNDSEESPIEVSKDPYGDKSERASLKAKISSELYPDPMDEAAHASGHSLEDFIEERAGIELGKDTKHIKVSDEAFSKISYDDFNEHGFQNVGISSFDFEDKEYNSELEEVFNSLPQDLKDKYQNNESWVLVKKDNVDSLVDNHILTNDVGVRAESSSPEMKETYNNMISEIKSSFRENRPHLISVDESGKENIAEHAMADFKNYIARDLMKDSRLVINGEGFHVNTPELYTKNFAKGFLQTNSYKPKENKNKISSAGEKSTLGKITSFFRR